MDPRSNNFDVLSMATVPASLDRPPLTGTRVAEDRQRTSGTSVATPRVYFTIIDQLRGLAALLVVYSHLVGNFLEMKHRGWPIADVVRTFVHDPLHAELNFGWLGVALFFFVSGFVVTHAALRESPGVYVVRRLLRIYPPLIATALLVTVLAYLGTFVSGLTSTPDPLQLLLGASLGNYLQLGQPLLIAVGWTLVIEMSFYAGLLATSWLLKRVPALATTALLVVVAIVVTLHAQLGTTFALAAAFVAFVPLLLAGQVVYFLRMRILPVWAGLLLVPASWAVFVYGMHKTSPLFADPANGYLSNAALAFAVFVVAVLLEGRVKPFAPLTVAARRSYSLYLLHVPVGFTLLVALVDGARLPYTVALFLSLLAVAVATEIAYRFVERPSIQLARWLTTPRQPLSKS
ncbi:acyltransferase family protein [Leifsonia sp. RAF41]|uniref:acyltransferase family protein n=1 Tax=Leifsonia sp. RAF41 TaxID=3233056 RepID=UPI003F986D84